MTNIGRVRAASSGWPGGPGLNTFYFLSETGSVIHDPDESDAQLMHDRVHAAFTAAAEIYPGAWTCTVSPTVDVLQDTDGELVDSLSVDPSAPVVGAGVGGFGPTAVTLLAQLRTSTFADGARLQGRAFLGPLSAVNDDNGSPSGLLLAEAVLFGDALMDEGVAADNPSLVVWRRPRIAVPAHVPPITARAGSIARVTSITVPDKYAVLRSRRD